MEARLRDGTPVRADLAGCRSLQPGGYNENASGNVGGCPVTSLIVDPLHA